MHLTPAQLATLKAAIDADPTMSALPLNDDGATAIAVILNTIRSPDYWIWRTAVSKEEYVNGLGPEGTVFSWTGAGFITRSVGERDAWRELFNSRGVANPSLTPVRQAFTDIFSGATAPAPANRTHLAAVSRRRATLVEWILRTNTAVGSTAAPDTMGAEGPVIYQDVVASRNL